MLFIRIILNNEDNKQCELIYISLKKKNKQKVINKISECNQLFRF